MSGLNLYSVAQPVYARFTSSSKWIAGTVTRANADGSVRVVFGNLAYVDVSKRDLRDLVRAVHVVEKAGAR